MYVKHRGDDLLIEVTTRVNRPCGLIVFFEGNEIICHDLRSSLSFFIDNNAINILALCGGENQKGRNAVELARQTHQEPEALLGAIALLREQGLLETCHEKAEKPMASMAWALQHGWRLFELAGHRSGHHTAGVQPNTEEIPQVGQPATVPLTEHAEPEVSLAACFRARRSWRAFGPRPLAVREIGGLLGLASSPIGTISEEEEQEAIRALGEEVALAGRKRYPYPTPGALNGLRVLLAVGRVEGMQEGLYRFDQDAPGLLGIAKVPFKRFCCDVLPGLDWVARSAAVVVVMGEVAPLRRHYRHPYLLALSEAGHLLQNLLLVAAALDLAACELGAIEEDALFALTGQDDYLEVPLGAIAVGPLP